MASIKGRIITEETRRKIGDANRVPLYFNCGYCGKEVVTTLSVFSRYERHYCSTACCYKYKKENGTRPCSEEAKIKIGIANSHPKSESAKEKMSIAQFIRFKNKENHPRWKGGPSNYVIHRRPISKEYRNWRSLVFERDNYTCQGCSKTGGYLESHHIKSWARFPDLRYILENGSTLCKDCHKLTNNYGNKKYETIS
jgi:5-methylcytosine-specific restriction endonuclease McrA